MTEWFVEELAIHAKGLLGHDISFVQKLVVFRRYAARIAYKAMDFKAPGCPENEACRDTVTVSGHCIHKSDLGNITFGAMGELWRIPEPLLVFAGMRAATRSTTGGIDSPEDMAATIAGIQVGLYMRDNALSPDVFARQITQADNTLIDVLVQRLGNEVAKLVKQAVPSPIAAVGNRYAKCQPCRVAIPKDKAHSAFASLAEQKHFFLAEEEWWNVYKGCESDMVDTTRIPFPKEE